MSFQKTVNLKGEKEEKPVKKKKPSRASSIDRVYSDSDDDLRKISRPAPRPRRDNEKMYKYLTFFLFAVFVILALYFVFGFLRGRGDDNSANFVDENWYLITLPTGEEYYGQINSPEADPLELRNIYYDYDKLNPDEAAPKEDKNLRLIKRGKDSSGTTGTMLIPNKCNAIKIEPLADDSKILEAILSYEQK